MGWLVPCPHGLEHPAYPTWVAVIVIKATFPPERWSR